MTGNIQAGQIQFGADASGFNAEIASASEVAKTFGRAIDDVNRRAENLGSSSESANRRVEAATRNMVGSIQRTIAAMEAGAKSGSDYYLALAGQRGIDTSALRPYLDQLDQTKNRLDAAAEAARKFADDQAFQKKLDDARQLNQASEYVRFWTLELEKADAAERTLSGQTAFIDGLKKQSDAIGKTRADLLELQAAEIGVSDKAAPFIARLREAEAGIGKTGMSTAAMNAALRNVPAQLTDIVVSLQAGQQPLTVLLQQGGQLKDMFGGIGPAARAMGSYLLSLVNPLTVLAAAFAAIGYGMYKGAEQYREYQNALTLTGNAAGITASQMDALRGRVAETTREWGNASDAVLELVKSGKISGDVLEEVALSTVRWAKATGQSVRDVAKEYSDLAKDPVKSVVELSEKYGFLTASTYYQVAALEKLGRTQEAAILLQRRLSEESDKAAKKVIENAGWIDQLLSDIKSGAGQGYDWINSWGKPTTSEDDANSIRQKIAVLEQNRAPGNPLASWDDDKQRELDQLKKELAAVEKLIEAQKKGAEQTSKVREENQLSVKAVEALTEAARAGISPEERRLDTVRKLRIEYERATTAAAGLSEEDRAKTEKNYAMAVRLAEAANQPRVDNNRLLDAIAQVESGGQQFYQSGNKKGQVVTSGAGAIGMYQIMPSSGPDLAKRAGVQWSEDRLRQDAGYGRQLASAYIDFLMTKFDGDLDKSLTAYHSGQGTVGQAIADAGVGGDWKSKLGPKGRAYSNSVLGQFDRDVSGNFVGGPTINTEALEEQKRIREMQDESRSSLAALEATQQGYTRTMSDFIGLKATDAWRAMTPEMQKQQAAVAASGSSMEILSQAYETHRGLTQSVAQSEREFAAASITAASGWREVSQAQAEFDRLKLTASWEMLTEKVKSTVSQMFAADQAQRQVDASFRNATGLKLQADQLEETNRLYGMTEIQIGEYRLAVLEAQAASASAAGASADRLRAMQAEADQQGRINEAMRQSKELDADWRNGANTAINDYVESSKDKAGQMKGAFTGAFTGMEDAAVRFVKTAKLSLADLADSFISELVRMSAKAAISPLANMLGSAIGSWIGGGDTATTNLDFGSTTPDYMGGYSYGSFGHATGGHITGPGTATSDSIPAWLSNGEYVIQASAVSHYGTEFFDRINTRRFATGGQVGAASAGAGVPNMKVELINKSSQPVAATQSDVRFNGKEYVIGIVLEDIQRNGKIGKMMGRR